jgi:hypothetical protein
MYFRAQMDVDKGTVPIRVIASFNRVKSFLTVAKAKLAVASVAPTGAATTSEGESVKAAAETTTTDTTSVNPVTVDTETPQWPIQFILGALTEADTVELLDTQTAEPLIRRKENWEQWVIRPFTPGQPYPQQQLGQGFQQGPAVTTETNMVAASAAGRPNTTQVSPSTPSNTNLPTSTKLTDNHTVQPSRDSLQAGSTSEGRAILVTPHSSPHTADEAPSGDKAVEDSSASSGAHSKISISEQKRAEVLSSSTVPVVTVTGEGVKNDVKGDSQNQTVIKSKDEEGWELAVGKKKAHGLSNQRPQTQQPQQSQHQASQHDQDQRMTVSKALNSKSGLGFFSALASPQKAPATTSMSTTATSATTNSKLTSKDTRGANEEEGLFSFDDEGEWDLDSGKQKKGSNRKQKKHDRGNADENEGDDEMELGAKSRQHTDEEGMFELDEDAVVIGRSVGSAAPNGASLVPPLSSSHRSVSSLSSSFGGRRGMAGYESVDEAWNDLDDDEIAGLMIVTQRHALQVTTEHDLSSPNSPNPSSLSNRLQPPSPSLRPHTDSHKPSHRNTQTHHNLPPRKHNTVGYDRSNRNNEVNEIINEGLYFYEKDMKRKGGVNARHNSNITISSSAGTSYSPSSAGVSLLTSSLVSQMDPAARPPIPQPAGKAVSALSSSLKASSALSASVSPSTSFNAQTFAAPSTSLTRGGAIPKPIRQAPRRFFDSTTGASPPVGWLIHQHEPPTPPLGPSQSPLLVPGQDSSRPPLPPDASPLLLPSTSARNLDIPMPRQRRHHGDHHESRSHNSSSFSEHHQHRSGSYKGQSYKEFQSFQHPSYELLKENGFVQHKYHKYHAKALKGMGRIVDFGFAS